VDREVLARWLHELSADGLIEAGGAGRLTERGRRVLDSGAYTAPVEERRAFTFLDEGDTNSPLFFVALQGRAVALAPPPGWRFEPATLEESVRQPPEWKTRHGFSGRRGSRPHTDRACDGLASRDSGPPGTDSDGLHPIGRRS